MQKIKKPAVIFDLDGTLASVKNRVKYMQQTPKDREAFHSRIMEDEVNEWCRYLINITGKDNCIIILTCRPNKYIEITKEWLKQHKIKYDILIMRKDGDKRPDPVVKKELYRKLIVNNFDVQFTVEDRNSCVKMWRELGLVCLQPYPGDF